MLPSVSDSHGLSGPGWEVPDQFLRHSRGSLCTVTYSEPVPIKLFPAEMGRPELHSVCKV